MSRTVSESALRRDRIDSMVSCRRCFAFGLVLVVLLGLAAPMFAEPDCGCCGGTCDAGCCMLKALAGFAIGHPSSERPHWKPPTEVRAELPCAVTGAASALPTPRTAEPSYRAPGITLDRWSRPDDSTAPGLSPCARPAAPRGPPLPQT
ncbi:MAG: hypothetical protein AAF481_02100 [Acidobacteriota bacterium]